MVNMIKKKFLLGHIYKNNKKEEQKKKVVGKPIFIDHYRNLKFFFVSIIIV
jgi:hypothetical protein